MSLEKNNNRYETLYGWGNYPECKTNKITPNTLKELKNLSKTENIIARGNGRSYGDSAASENITIDMKSLNEIESFEPASGEIIAQAGVLLSTIISNFLPMGWFPYVTPGTKFVTVGGMIASDVHGKNHHKEGSFYYYINWIELLDSQGNIIRCSRQENEEMFEWTIGGMGLTGIIYRASFILRKVESSWIKSKKIVTNNLNDSIDVMEENLNSLYSVAWIDCTCSGKSIGRSVVYLGEHASKEEVTKSKKRLFSLKQPRVINVPFFLPKYFMNYFFIKIFNNLYYFLNKIMKKESIVSWQKYFYPLDKIGNWNRLYGKNGFYQFQCVIPLENSKIAINKIIKLITEAKTGSFLGVLKRFGKQSGMISFPREGYTLTLDFPRNSNIENLLIKLDEVVIKNNGRFYLAKDARVSSSNFLRSDARFSEFLKYRKNKNLKNHFESYQSKRLNI